MRVRQIAIRLPAIRGLIALAALCAITATAMAQDATPHKEMVRMRDGVELATDVYLPKGTGKFPVLLCRTPYGKAGVHGDAVYLARRGYVVLAQDCRGRFESQGRFYGFVNEGPDSYDTIEWAASQPWSDGRIGTFGASYLAWDQYFGAMLRPPHLTAMFVLVGGAKFYDEYAYPGGIPNLGWPVWILKSAQTSPNASKHPQEAAKMLELLQKTPVPWLKLSPQQRGEIFRDFPDQQRMYSDFLKHPQFDAYWKQRGFYTAGYYNEMKDVPMFFLTGWYDYFADGVLENFEQLSKLQHTMKRLLVGPWPHATGAAQCGDAWFGKSAAVDQRALMADWFDHWMKGDHFKLVSSMPVRYFRMGGGDGSRASNGKFNHGGEWMTSLSWPLADVKTIPYYLHENEALNTNRPFTETASHFNFDPKNPVPTLGGRYGLGAWSRSCAQDGRMNRRDVLAFVTPPLHDSVDVTGRVSATLWVTSDAPSVDFAAKLMDVYPSGYALTLADGATRVTIQKKGTAQKITVNLGAISNLFQPGHRIQLYVTSSNFPKLEPNRHPAHNTIFHDRPHESSINLPIVATREPFGNPVRTTLMVPMRDGVRLATDVYLPARSGKTISGKFPVLVTRSPYNKNGERERGDFFARKGYVFVAQDTRGRYGSEGKAYPLIHEANDGYDTIEWAAAQPWSNGKVGTTGASYLAMDQYAAAIKRPPHLIAMYAAVGGANYYYDAAYRGGIPGLGWPVWLLFSAATDPKASQVERDHLMAIVKNPDSWLAKDRQTRARLLENFPAQHRAYEDFYAHPHFDSYWKQPGFDTADFYQEMKDVPIFFLSGWYDSFAESTLRNFTSLRHIQKTPKRLIMGPWPHGYGKSKCGDAFFGPQAELDEMPLQLDWFNHWMKGAPIQLLGEKPVRYFRMGGGGQIMGPGSQLDPGGQWFASSSWPPAPSKISQWYLHTGSSLSRVAPLQEPAEEYTYNPSDPVHTSGARQGSECIVNQNVVRPDILSFLSAPLKTAEDVTGTSHLVLWVSSDAPSADFTAKLIDVYPNGYAAPLLDAAIRVRFSGAGQPQKIIIQLGTTSNLFSSGHRIRIDVSSSSFPKLEPNPNPAHNKIYHDRLHASYLDLAVTGPYEAK